MKFTDENGGQWEAVLQHETIRGTQFTIERVRLKEKTNAEIVKNIFQKHYKDSFEHSESDLKKAMNAEIDFLDAVDDKIKKAMEGKNGK